MYALAYRGKPPTLNCAHDHLINKTLRRLASWTSQRPCLRPSNESSRVFKLAKPPQIIKRFLLQVLSRWAGKDVHAVFSLYLAEELDAPAAWPAGITGARE